MRRDGTSHSITSRVRLCVLGLWLGGMAAALAQTNGTPWTSQLITNYVSPIVGGTPDTVAVWYGNRVAIVVDPQSSLPSPNFATMTNIAFAFDNLYTAYDQVTGQTPLTGNYLLNGKIRVEFTTNMPTGVAGTASDNSGYYGIAVGNPADFVVLDAATEAEAIRLTSECLFVVRKGQVVASTTPAVRRVTLGGRDYPVDFKRA